MFQFIDLAQIFKKKINKSVNSRLFSTLKMHWAVVHQYIRAFVENQKSLNKFTALAFSPPN